MRGAPRSHQEASWAFGKGVTMGIVCASRRSAPIRPKVSQRSSGHVAVYVFPRWEQGFFKGFKMSQRLGHDQRQRVSYHSRAILQLCNAYLTHVK